MKTFGAILCYLAIALNTALGFSGAVLFCEHESGDSHLVSKSDHAAETHGESCHSGNAIASEAHGQELDCDSCIDTEIASNSSLDDAPPQLVRSVVKSPPVAVYVVPTFLVSIPEDCFILRSHLSRAPPVHFSAIIQYTDTVQSRC